MPSFGVTVAGDRLRVLREQSIPIIARVRDGWTYIDLRSADPADDALVAAALATVTVTVTNPVTNPGTAPGTAPVTAPVTD